MAIPRWLPWTLLGVGVLGGLSCVTAVVLLRPSAPPPPEPAHYIAAEPSPTLTVPVTATTGARSVLWPLGPIPGGRVPPGEVLIPSIGVDSRLVDLGLQDDGTLQVPKDFAVAGWYSRGPIPGDRNGPPAIIAGHVDSVRGPAVFYRLRDLKQGDQVVIRRLDGRALVFRVYRIEHYPKDAFPAAQVYGSVSRAELRVITCTGSFDRSKRSYRDNLVVYASLVGGA